MNADFVSPDHPRDPHSNRSRSIAAPIAFPVALAMACVLTIGATPTFANDQVDPAR